jgi:general secretion pathway protein J
VTHRRPDRRRAGFSLVEVLAALAATVLVIGAFSPFAAQLVASWGRGARTAEFVDMATTAFARLDRDLRGTVPLFITRGEETSMVFRGGPGYVLFASATGFGPGREGIELVSLAVEANAAGVSLIRRHAPLGTSPDGQGFRDPVVLFTGRYRFNFAFVDDAGKRSAEWVNRPAMPRRVELSILDADGRPALPAAVSFAVPADYPAACLASDPPQACEALEGDREQRETLPGD